MRAPSLALALALAAVPAWAIDVIELKDGKVLEVERATLKGTRLHVELFVPSGNQKVGYAIPMSRVVPEYIYYVWAEQIGENSDDHLRLAAWSRKQGIFRHAWKSYEVAAKSDANIKKSLPELAKAMHEEEATFLFDAAWRLFRDGEVKSARRSAERVLEHFSDTGEKMRTQDLLNIIQEREQFLSEQKKQNEIARIARRQRRTIGHHLKRIARAEKSVRRVSYRYPADAKRKLRRATYYYRKALYEIADMMPAVEVDELRRELTALGRDIQAKHERTLLQLSDLRYVTGDNARALDSIHEVLALNPANRDAQGLRRRILDEGISTRPAVNAYNPYGGNRNGYYVGVGGSGFGRYGGYTSRIHPAYQSTINGFGIYVPRQRTFRFRHGYYWR